MNRVVKGEEHEAQYEAVYGDVSRIIDAARESAVRSVNAAMTSTYWPIGHRIVVFEQSEEERAEYGTALLERLAFDLTRRYGRGFSRQNLQHMRAFYLAHPPDQIRQTPCGGFAPPATVSLRDLLTAFRQPWSAYVRLMSVKIVQARAFSGEEALRGGWSVRRLDRQINSQFYERTVLSKNKAAMLTKRRKALSLDLVRPEEESKDPFVLEFPDLKDEYSESDLQGALIRHLETFLLELRNDSCFVGRQKRLRVGAQWYRLDLLFLHRSLRCPVVIDLKIGRFTHAAAGQMHFYPNCVRENWVREAENPAVGLSLCSEKDEALAQNALDGLPNKVLTAEYWVALPYEENLLAELDRTRQAIELHSSVTL